MKAIDTERWQVLKDLCQMWDKNERSISIELVLKRRGLLKEDETIDWEKLKELKPKKMI